MKLKLIIFVFLFGFLSNSIAQGKIDITCGFGFPEYLNGGVRFQINQAQLGISIGSLPIKGQTIITIGGDLYYHVGKISKFSNRRPWYGRCGLIYGRDEMHSLIHNILHLNLRLGRDINFSKKVGINLDLGLIFELLHKVEDKDPENMSFILDMPIVLPSGGLSFFFRI